MCFLEVGRSMFVFVLPSPISHLLRGSRHRHHPIKPSRIAPNRDIIVRVEPHLDRLHQRELSQRQPGGIRRHVRLVLNSERSARPPLDRETRIDAQQNAGRIYRQWRIGTRCAPVGIGHLHVIISAFVLCPSR